jgi:hypothetical protein
MGVGIAARRRGGESELELGPVGACRGHGRGEGGGRVDDEQIARGEVLRQVTEASVHDAARPARGDEQADAVTGALTGLRRLVRLKAGAQPEGAQADTATGSLTR